MTRRVIYQRKADVAQVGDPITLDRWFGSLSVPVRRGALATVLIASGIVLPPPQVTPVETITADKWLRPLEMPLRRPAAISTAAQQFASFPAQAVPLPEWPRWGQPLSEPPRPAKFLPAALRDPATALGGVPIVGLDKWYASLGTPPARPRALSVALQRATAADPVITIRADGWLASFAIPEKRHYAGTILPASPGTPFIGGEIITADKWLNQLYNPQKQAPNYAALRYAYFGISTVPPPSLGWLREWVRPPVGRAPLPRSAISSWTGPVSLVVPPEVVTLDKWYAALGGPRAPGTLRFAAYRYLADFSIRWDVIYDQVLLLGSSNMNATLAGDSDIPETDLAGTSDVTVTLAGDIDQAEDDLAGSQNVAVKLSGDTT